jgi:hypothetical protein
MLHSERALNVFAQISTRISRAFKSPTFKSIYFLVGARNRPSFDSALLVSGQISYWIQMWLRVYKFHIGFGIAEDQTWRAAQRFRSDVHKKFLIRQNLTNIFEPPKIKDIALMRLYDVAIR